LIHFYKRREDKEILLSCFGIGFSAFFAECLLVNLFLGDTL